MVVLAPCPILHLAAHAALAIGVHPELLDHGHNRCYCGECEPNHRPRRDGEGAIPRGYSRVGVKVSPATTNSRGVFATWPKAYHGTKVESIAKIVQTGHLLTPGSVTLEGRELPVRDGHLKKREGGAFPRRIELDDIREGRAGTTAEVRIAGRDDTSSITQYFAPWECVFLSPTHVYAECPVYTNPKRLDSDAPRAMNGLTVHCLLEMRIARGTFDVGKHTVTQEMLNRLTSTPFCKTSSEWEWYTRRYGRMVVTGLLVKFADLSNRREAAAISSRLAEPPGWITGHDTSQDALADVLAGALLRTPSLQRFVTCPTARLAMEAVNKLGVPLMLFDHRHNLCYCGERDQCQHPRVASRAGKPYYLPLGYTRIALRIDDARCAAEKAFDVWPVAFHGLTFTNVRGVLDCGALLPTGSYGPSGKRIGSRDTPDQMRTGRTKESTPNEDGIFFSPVADYAAHPVHATWERVVLNGVPHEVSVVLQLRVRPEYEVGPSTIEGFAAPLGCEYGNQLEWSTKRHASVMVYGILLKFRDCDLSSPLTHAPAVPASP